MCKGVNCPVRWSCYRFTANPDYIQSYFSESPIDEETKECNYFWDNKGKHESKDKDGDDGLRAVSPVS